MKKVLVLLSGGLDSTCILASAVRDYECAAVAFDYGQPHVIELSYAAATAASYGVPFRIVHLPRIPLLKDSVVFAGRNLVLAAHAIAIAAAEGFDAIAVGSNQSDWETFPDCRPPFWRAVREAAEVYGIEVVTPLMDIWKTKIIELAKKFDVPLASTWSCYSPQDGEPCGKCLACRTRNEAVKTCQQYS